MIIDWKTRDEVATLYNRRKGDMTLTIPPPDYVTEEWVLIDRFGRVVKTVPGQAIRNWVRRMTHGVLWVKCRIENGVAILPGRLT